MAKSKQYNIRWTQSDNDQLRKAVKNYNAKIRRLEKKYSGSAGYGVLLPERITVKEMKELINTRNDLQREINSLRRFTKRGSEKLVDVPDNKNNIKITKWQRDETRRRLPKINKKRAEEKEKLLKIEKTSSGEGLGYTNEDFGMGSQDRNAFKPQFDFKYWQDKGDIREHFKFIIKESSDKYWEKTNLVLRDNYVNSLLENFNPKDVQDIVDKVNNMDFDDFYRIFKGEAGLFEWNYPPSQAEYDAYLSKIRSIWMPNKI